VTVGANSRFVFGRHDRRTLCFWLLAFAALQPWMLAGCATEEIIKKSNGYYQEGVANLSVDRQKAFVSFQKAIQLNPDNKQAHYGLGHIYALQGKFKEAEEAFREAIRLDDDYSEAHTYLGQVLAQQGRWTDAIKSYKRALSNPLYATPDLARYHLGRALAHEGDMQAAVEAFEDALLVNPPSVPPAMLHLELGRAYYKLGYDSKAREILAKVSTFDKGGEYTAVAEQLLERLKR
jgi:type IV pilus assembly protein PilF